MNDEELAFKKATIEAAKATKKKLDKRGRPKGVKNGQGKTPPKKKRTGPKKVAKKKSERKSLYRKDEREKIRRHLVEYFGASKVDRALVKASTVAELSEVLRRLQKEMELELEAAEKEVEQYYMEIDAEYRKVGRPKSVFNERELKYLCSIQCTLEEIAGFFQMNKVVLKRRVKEEYGITWNEFYERNSQGVKVALRRRQVQAAMEGDSQMMKFLGKNILGQKEKLDFDGEVKVNSWVDLVTGMEKAAGLEKNDDANESESDES